MTSPSVPLFRLQPLFVVCFQIASPHARNGGRSCQALLLFSDYHGNRHKRALATRDSQGVDAEIHDVRAFSNQANRRGEGAVCTRLDPLSHEAARVGTQYLRKDVLVADEARAVDGNAFVNTVDLRRLVQSKLDTRPPRGQWSSSPPKRSQHHNHKEESYPIHLGPRHQSVSFTGCCLLSASRRPPGC